MIQGRSNFVYRIIGTNKFVSYNLRNEYETTEIHVDVNLVNNDILNVVGFMNWLPEYKNAEFIFEADGKYHCGHAVEKMSKSMYNVVNPDEIIDKYGADTLRMYEMFLGPLELSKPWDTNGIEGVYRFFNKLWRLFIDTEGKIKLTIEKPSVEEQKIINKTVKRIQEDIERLSMNTCVSGYMMCVNELSAINCANKEVLEKLLILLSPFAPHIAEELWQMVGNTESITKAEFPKLEEKYLKEDTVKYPIAFNGKVRFDIEVSAKMKKADIEKTALSDSRTVQRLEGSVPKKIIVVPGKMVNIVL
jgi:leucyl-tRNA synthetase